MDKNFIPRKLYRKIINNVPLCCVDLIVKKGDRFLLIKRSENPAKNKWWFTGGRIFFNESLESAVRRKLREEINIKRFKKIKPLGVQGLKFKKGLFNEPVYSIANVFLVEIDKKDKSYIKIDRISSDYRWFNHIPKNLSPYIKKYLKLAGFKKSL